MMNIGICSLEMSAVTAVYMLLLKLLKSRQSPVWRYYSWIIILIGFLVPIKPWVGKSEIIVQAPIQNTAVTDVLQTPANQNKTSYAVDFWRIIFCIWLCGALVYLAVMTYRCIYFNKSVKRLSVSADENKINLANLTAKEMGISASVKVIILSEIGSPMMFGLLSPVILLPNRIFAEDELRLIFKHELTHFKHKDLWVKILIILCRAVHWFNPLLITVSHAVEQECELACDYDVIKNEGVQSRKTYCKSILKAASVQKETTCERVIKPVVATSFYSPKQGLKSRMKMILSLKKRKRFVTVCIFTAVLTCVSGARVVFANDSSESRVDIPQNISENADKNVDITSKIEEKKKNSDYATTTRKSTDKSVEDDSAVTTITLVGSNELNDKEQNDDLPTTSTVPVTYDMPADYLVEEDETTTTTVTIINSVN